MRHIVELCMTDYAKGDSFPLSGMLDWLLNDLSIPPERIYKIAWRQWGIPRHVVQNTIFEIL